MFYSAYYHSPIGKLMLAGDEQNLTGLWIEKQKYYADTAPEDIREKEDLPVFVKTKEWLDQYFDGRKPVVWDLPLAPRGGEFRQAVWKILCEIPSGQVLTYGGIAGFVVCFAVFPKGLPAKPAERRCRLRRSAERSGIIRFQSLFPATGLSEQTAA